MADSRLSPRGRFIPAIFAAADIALVNLLFALVCALYPHIGAAGDMRLLWVLVNVCMLPTLWWSMKRGMQRAMLLDVVARQAITDTGLHALFFLASIALLRIDSVPLRALAVFYGMMFGGMMLLRLGSRAMLKLYRRHGRGYARVVIVGANPTGERLARELRRDAGYGYRLLGFFDDERPKGFGDKYVGTLEQLPAFLRANSVHQVFYCRASSGGGAHAAEVLRMADDAGADFLFVPLLSRYVQRPMAVSGVGQMTVMGVLPNPLKSVLNRGIKRAFDLVVSSLFLCVYPLIYVPVAIAIKMSGPGPVYFRQARTGYHGRTFTCLKFRTMRSSSDADTRQASAGDDRVTRLGAWLRRTSIDELPQFINVWRGDMSIVGPRPHMLRHTDDYSKLVDRYMARHAVKPGITGWAQVTGLRGPTDELWKMERRVEADVWYIEHWTLLLDIKIMFRTVINAIAGDPNAL